MRRKRFTTQELEIMFADLMASAEGQRNRITQLEIDLARQLKINEDLNAEYKRQIDANYSEVSKHGKQINDLQWMQGHIEELNDRIFQLENPPKFKYDDQVIFYGGGLTSVSQIITGLASTAHVGRILKYVGCRVQDPGFTTQAAMPYASLYSDPFSRRSKRENLYQVECEGEVYTVKEEDIQPYSPKLWADLQPKKEEEKV